MLNYKFDKAFYNEKELLTRLPIPRSTFYKWQAEWISKGHDPKLMGKIIINNTSTVFWNGAVFLEWLEKYKFNMDVQYDYEAQDKKAAVLVVANLITKKIRNSNDGN